MHAGMLSGNGAALTTDAFSCVGWSSPDPQHWLGFFQAPPFREAWIPILSAGIGILSSAYHLTRIYTTDEASSLWALPDPELGPTGAARPSRAAVAPLPAANPHPSSSAASAGTAGSDPAADVLGRGVCEADERNPEGIPASALTAHAPATSTSAVVRTASPRSIGGFRVDPPDPPRNSGHGRVLRESVRGLLAAQPQLAQLLQYTAAVYACFVVDVTVTMHLWWQLIAMMMLVAPHLSLHGTLIAAVFGLAAGRAAVVAGTRSLRAWLSAFGKVCRCFARALGSCKQRRGELCCDAYRDEPAMPLDHSTHFRCCAAASPPLANLSFPGLESQALLRCSAAHWA